MELKVFKYLMQGENEYMLGIYWYWKAKTKDSKSWLKFGKIKFLPQPPRDSFQCSSGTNRYTGLVAWPILNSKNLKWGGSLTNPPPPPLRWELFKTGKWFQHSVELLLWLKQPISPDGRRVWTCTVTVAWKTGILITELWGCGLTGSAAWWPQTAFPLCCMKHHIMFSYSSFCSKKRTLWQPPRQSPSL